MALQRWLRALALIAVVLVSTSSCGLGTTRGQSHLQLARVDARGSNDADMVGRWALLELVAPGGSARQLDVAQKKLDALGDGGADAWLARALWLDLHGRFPRAATAYLEALAKLRREARPDSALIAWFVASRLTALDSSVTDLWARAKPLVLGAMRSPEGIGWRARSELVEWWSRRIAQDRDGPDGEALTDAIADQHGCIRHARMAGPFGRGLVGDHRMRFEAEGPAPWPARFAESQAAGRTPRVMDVERHACLLAGAEASDSGVFYVQSFVDLPDERDVIVAVQGAYAVFVDDALVLSRDRGEWGAGPRFGVQLRLGAGRHRILARIMGQETAIRLLGPAGEPIGIVGSAEQGAPYVLSLPVRLAEPNVLEPFLRAVGVKAPSGASRSLKNAQRFSTNPATSLLTDTDDPILRYLASYLAHVDGADDIASVLLEPLVKQPARATAAALAQQALFVDGDPIFPAGVARDMARNLRQQAVDRDPHLWGPQLWLALEKADKADPAELVAEMEALAARFPEVPVVVMRLANLYARLGWQLEKGRALESAAKLFPRDIDAKKALLLHHEERGKTAEADALADEIRRLDPGEEVTFERALARRDYDAAAAELQRIATVRKDRKSIALRIADLLVRAGKSRESLGKLILALEGAPRDTAARMALADARFAAGDRDALTEALVEAIRTGADDTDLRAAIELVEGETHLEPYRRDGLLTIREAKEAGVELPGSAARILDYAALWIAPDGSARMLEHEIVRLQSREGIARHAEQPLPRGMLLKLRTIKSDGRILEPEIVAGKPTVTMPHLEVGDYIETESIWVLRSGGGRSFRAPRWFFREENTSYHVSELVVIAPATRDLDVETTGQVPEPSVQELPGLTVRRWRVEGSIALPEEPLAAPVQEFLPSVRVGWGVDLDSELRDLVLRQSRDTVRDPRLVRIARSIVAEKVGGQPGGAKSRPSEQARRIYRWVLDAIEEGEEREPAKIVTGKSGDRTLAFLYLCRLVGIDARLGLVRDRLSPPARGPFSKAETYNVLVVRIVTESGPRWLMVRDRFAPFGYLPSSLGGQPAVLLESLAPLTTVEPPGLERENTGIGGEDSGIEHRARVTLRADGSAEMKLEQIYRGRYAVQLRTALADVPEARRRDVVEAQLLSRALPGGRLVSLALPNLDRLDEPVRLVMDVEVPNFARLAQGELVLTVPFLGSIEPIVQLPTRETPLYISERVAARTDVIVTIALPAGAKVVGSLAPVKLDDKRLVVRVGDRVQSGKLVIERRLHLPAGRVQPDEYPTFKEVVTRASEALNRTIRMQLR